MVFLLKSGIAYHKARSHSDTPDLWEVTALWVCGSICNLLLFVFLCLSFRNSLHPLPIKSLTLWGLYRRDGVRHSMSPGDMFFT